MKTKSNLLFCNFRSGNVGSAMITGPQLGRLLLLLVIESKHASASQQNIGL